MNKTSRHRALRIVLTFSLATGAWSLAASTQGAAPTPLGAAPTTAGPEGVLLAQVGAPAPDDVAARVAAADIGAGQVASLQCAGCHSFGQGEAPRLGPNLYGLVGRPVASVPGFGYSPAMVATGAAGGTWAIEFLDAFLTSPQTAIPGTTMPFAGIQDEGPRANLIGYLTTLAGEGAAAGVDGGLVGTPVRFTNTQAARGETRYTRDCVECHGTTLNGGLLGGPPLRGLAFEEKYLNGASAAVLFLFMSTAMPPENPGRFNAFVYADLMAYILQQNGFNAGAEELPTDLEALNNLTMVK